MTGIADDNRPAFRKAASALRAAGYEVVSPDELDQISPAGGHTWADYLTRDIPFVASCGLGVVLPGWAKSRGSLLEIAILASLGRPVFSLLGNLDNITANLFGDEDPPRLVEIPPEKLPRVTLPATDK